MPPLLLTILKFLFLALLYLFIARAVRVIYLDLVGPRVPRARGARPAAQPVPAKRRKGQPSTLVVTDSDSQPRPYPISSEPLSIGRSSACQVVLQDTYVSQVHARLFPKDGQWFVEDLGSTNGTYLNRTKVTEASPVGVGDEIRIGKTTLEVRR